MDEYFNLRFANPSEAKKPTQNMPNQISEIIEYLGSSISPEKIRFAHYLMDLASDAREELADKIEYAFRRQRELKRAVPLAAFGEIKYCAFISMLGIIQYPIQEQIDYAYRTKIGLNVARSALGLREDINNFNIVDMAELKARRRQNRRVLPPIFDQYSYQVAIAALSGFTTQAQEFAAAYRIPLIEFNKLPFWNEFCQTVGYSGFHFNARRVYFDMIDSENRLLELADKIGQRMAVAITNSGQMLFLYHTTDEHIHFNEYYSLHWEDPKEPWILRSDQEEYLFQLPESILKVWLNKSTDELKMKREAINCKDSFLSHMVVYYTEDGQPAIKMISIDRFQLEEAIYRLG